jgi:hypothetical protein
VTTYYRRRRSGWRETVASALVGAGVGAVAFYLTRILASREAIPGEPRDREGDGLPRLQAPGQDRLPPPSGQAAGTE